MQGVMNLMIVEDDPRLHDLLVRVLSDEAHVVARARTLAEARLVLRERRHEVLVLDRMLPDGDGLELCDEIRRAGDLTPILMLTARGEIDDRVKGLRAGADDYLVKPFEIEELLARIDALARRARLTSTTTVGELEIDRIRREVRVRGAKVDLTAREYSLVACLAEHADQPMSRADLLSKVWGLSFDPGSGVLEVHISRLRDKLGDCSHVVETVRGTGYKLKTSRA
jgi:DNA-binding response OmpR family regulator